MLHLDQERRVVFVEGEKVFRHTFRRLMAADWAKYYGGLTIESEKTSSDARIDRVDFRTASLNLYDEAAIAAEGYQTKDGSPIVSLPNWKSLIPYGHRIAAADRLTQIERSTAAVPGDLVLDPEGVEVRLDAEWSEGRIDGSLGWSGKMEWHIGLTHFFEHPTAQDERKFNRASSESRVVGGTRTGKTIFVSHQSVLIALYDKLIRRVDGYAIGGKPLANPDPEVQRAEIAVAMDANHKVAAIGQLFRLAE